MSYNSNVSRYWPEASEHCTSCGERALCNLCYWCDEPVCYSRACRQYVDLPPFYSGGRETTLRLCRPCYEGDD